jgi:hypothetical protein
MKTFAITALFAIGFVAPLAAQPSYDTLLATQVGTDIWYYKVETPSVPWSIHMIKANLKNHYNEVMTATANGVAGGYEKTSEQAARHDRPEHVVVGAINGDFYGTGGVPINIDAQDGEAILHPYYNNRSVFGFDTANRPAVAEMMFDGKFIDGATWTKLHGVNKTRETNYLILYNRFAGGSTGTNGFGSEAVLTPLEAWAFNDTIDLVVEDVRSNLGNTTIPDGKVVLSGHGASQGFVDNLTAGDTVKIFQGLIPHGLPKLVDLIGGYPRIVHEGANYASQGYSNEGGPSHAFARHPRTAMGFGGADSSWLYLVVVDGRSPHSAGMTLPELADFMIAAGVEYGTNLDGGGSTTMLLRDSIVNVPSDGTERTVANSFLLISTAPSSGVVERARLNPSFAKLFLNETLDFTMLGYDDSFKPIPVDQDSVVFSCAPEVGSIDAAGMLTAGAEADTGYVYAEFRGYRDSALVVVKDITKLVLTPVSVTTDTSQTVPFSVAAFDQDGVQRTLTEAECEWTLSDSSVAEIDADGALTGLAEGTTIVIAEYNGASDTSSVVVEIGEGTVMLDGFEDLADWSLDGENVNLANSSISLVDFPRTQGDKALRVDYEFTYNNALANYISVVTEIPIYGLPDSLAVYVRSDGGEHHVRFIVSDDNGELYRIITVQFADNADAFDNAPTAVDRATAVSNPASFNFPITLKEIEVKLASDRVNGATYSGTLYFDNLRASYPGATTGVGEDERAAPSDFRLLPNYPNPFNPTTTIAFEVPTATRATVTVYDALGAEVATIFDGRADAGVHRAAFDAAGLSSGVYFYVLQTPEFRQARKMMVLK